MIITKTPLRITLGGGGTDMPSFYNKKNGYVISLAINKYIYIFLNKTFVNFYQLKYSNFEKVKNIEDIKHNLIRENFIFFNVKEKLELSSFADIPSGTGLGSSGTFGVGLFNALNIYYKKKYSNYEIAKNSSDIEINKVGAKIGHQDNFIATFGGLLEQKYKKNSILIKKLIISNSFKNIIKNNLVLFYTGKTRLASEVLSSQDNKINNNDKKTLKDLEDIKSLGLETGKIIKDNSFHEYYRILNEHWKLKKSMNKKVSNSKINDMYEFGLKNGALGGKLVGAGGGGFLMFFTKNKKKLVIKFQERNIKELDFNISEIGTKQL
jgi:D-glycero-alpha-D-manno-heptose-7-phosphate kinase